MTKRSRYWPILIIAAIWFIFASPYFLSGKIPFPSAYLAANYGPWNSYDLYKGPVKNGATPDVITQIFPWKKLVIESIKKKAIPFWNPYSFSGTPLLANYQSAALSPLNLLYFVFPFVDAWSIQIVLAPLIAGVFMYIFARSLKMTEFGSIVSSIAFMFCGFIVTWMMYGTLGYAILFLPLALFGIEKFYETRKWYYQLVLSISVPLSIFSGHFQTSIYYLLFVLGYLIFKQITQAKIRLFVLSIVSIGFGLLISAPQLLPTIELYLNSVRSEIFMKTEVIPWGYLPTFLAPDIFGNPVTRNDWFGHYAEWNAYIGLIPLVLGVFAVVRKRTAYILFFSIAAILAILFSFQTPLVDLLVAAKIPVLSTSAASRIIIIFSFSAAILSGFGFDFLIHDLRERNYKYITKLLYGCIAIFAILWGILIFKFFLPQEWVSVAISNFKLPSGILLTFVFLVVLAKLVKNKRTDIIACVVIILVAFDLLRFATKWQPFEDRTLIYPEVPVSKFLSNISGYDRAFGNFGQELTMIYKIPGLEGYDPLYIARYGEFINSAPDGHYHQADRSVTGFSKNGLYSGKILNFLGVKYIIHKIADGHAVWAFPFWNYPVDQFRTVYKDDVYQILENDKAFPRAFLAGSFSVVTDKKKILETIFHEDLDLERNAVLEENPGIELSGSKTGLSVIRNYESNKVHISTNSDNSSLLVLTDPFYPGWKAFVDGSQTKIFRTDYAFRSIVVPGGNHTVTFTYDPDSFKIGIVLGILGFLGILGENIYLWKKYRS